MPFFGVPIRNGLPIGLGSVAGFGAPQEFTPAELFIGGTAGTWYDPSDLTTMFTTSAGTTPVAMPGQGSAVAVGLILDKSQGLVLGSEALTNPGPGFTATTGWTSGRLATFSIVNGNFRVTNVNAYGQAYQALTTVIGTTYKVTVSVATAATLFDIFVGTTGPETGLIVQRSNNAAGTYTFYFVATTTTSWLTIGNSGATAGNSFDLAFATLKALPGNHAIAINDSTARPELRARVNLLTYSEEFDNGAWDFASQRTSIVTPGVPYYKLAEAAPAAGSVVQRIVNGVPSINNIDYTFSVVAKADTRKRVLLYHYLRGAWFDLVTGQCGADTTFPTSVVPTMVLQNDGSYICTMKFTAAFTGTDGIQIYIGTDTQTTVVTTRVGDGTSGILCKSADFRPVNIGAAVPAYQRIADANTYDTAGFPLYLRFDGIDDGMYTPANLNLSATDKVGVFAGVRKLSDAATQTLAELSSNSDVNNGTFGLVPRIPGSIQFYWQLRGTARIDGSVTSGFDSPVSGAVTGLFDISQATPATEIIGRINGTQRSLTYSGGADAGTGNFGTYPLYIGSRGNSSNRFNGHLHGLIVVGSAVSAGNISATESWMAGKTGIVI